MDVSARRFDVSTILRHPREVSGLGGCLAPRRGTCRASAIQRAYLRPQSVNAPVEQFELALESFDHAPLFFGQSQ